MHLFEYLINEIVWIILLSYLGSVYFNAVRLMSKLFKGSYFKNQTNRTSQYPHNRPLTTGTLESHYCLSTSRHPRTLPQAQSNWRLRHCGIGRESAWLEGRCARVPRSRAPPRRRHLSIHPSFLPSIHPPGSTDRVLA